MIETSDSGINSQLEAWLPKGQHTPPGLYLVATPIGNLADITLRAIFILRLADIILCEDTRVTRKLLSAYGISAKLYAYHEHNADSMEQTVLEQLQSGKRIALVSDAGTPLISDPGYTLVRAVQEAGIYLTSIPGVSSVITALTLSGMPTDQFLYVGFLPSKKGQRDKTIAGLATAPSTLVILEAPHRLQDALQSMQEGWPNRTLAVARELTKRHEELRRGTPAELLAYYTQHPPKGEIVLVASPPSAIEISPEQEALTLDSALAQALKTMRVKEASNSVADSLNLPRKQVYARALELKA